ncbi:uncharacterized protein LOC131313314 [Rhododendron vialii]|uniref:uncharacterized protein LOC131313314 n=1 Tax=Rhododendron vialii TaxID=182163 RepID=UPI00265E02F5|nr:uncharacterized protein LOC131313314 [Rhododendron vialii]
MSEQKKDLESGTVSSSGSTFVGSSSSGSWSRERRPITSTPLNGGNYVLWAKAVKVYYMGQFKDSYLTDEPPDGPTYRAWKAVDAHVRSELRNSMTEQVVSTLMFCDTAKEVWTQAKELYSGIDNLHRTYDLHRSFFDISQGADSFEDYYAKFRRICNELDICEPLSIDIQVMRRQRDRMRVTRFLSGASFDFGPMDNQILGSHDLPSLSEVFNRLRQSSSISTPTSGHSAMSSTISDGSVFSVSYGRGRGHESGFSGRDRNYGVSGHGFGSCESGFGGHGPDFGGRGGRGFGRGFGGRDSVFDTRGGRTSRGGGRGRDRDSRFYTHSWGTNHTAEFCYNLHDFPQAHQAASSQDTGQFTQSSVDSVAIPVEEYQRFLSFQDAIGSSTATLAQTDTSVSYVASSSSSPWVINSGATDHMTGSQDGEEDWWGH